MKKTVILIFVISALATSGFAQKETKSFSAGFGFEAGVPTGNISNAFNSLFGLTVRFSYHAGPGFITFTTGGIALGPKKIEGQPTKVGLEIPVKFGYKYIIQHHFFVMGEMGYASFKSYYGYQGSVLSTTSGSFVAAPAAGFQVNTFEASLRYEIISSNGGGGLLALRLGFNF